MAHSWYIVHMANEPLTETLRFRVSSYLHGVLMEAATQDRRKLSDQARLMLVDGLAERKKKWSKLTKRIMGARAIGKTPKEQK